MTDIAGSASTTAVAAVGSETSSSIDTIGDHDWFKVSLSAGQSITVTATGGGSLDTYLNIYDPTGTTILASNDDIVDGVNQNSRLTFTASSAGTYFIDVGAWHDQSTGTYDLFVEPSPPPVFTNDQIAFQLTNGYWGGDVHHWAVTQGGTLTVNISTLTAAEQTLARAALQEWSDIIGVHFQEVSSGGQIAFSDAEDTTAKGPVAQTDANWSSNGIITSANVQISQSWVNTYGTSLDSYSFQTYVHEIGHALGLGHAGEYNDTATYSTDALFANDAWSTSIMSYFDQQQNTYFANQGFSKLDVLTPMNADIIAMQSLYGLSTTTRAGDTTYGDNSNAGGIYDASVYPRAAFTIFDSGGNDTIDYSRVGVSQLINLNPETFSNVNGYVGNLSIARGTVIENAIGGSGADTIIGNSANNTLTGNLGADTLTGGGGNDTFKDTEAGHSGDTITDFHAGDQIIFTDATLASFSYNLSGNTLTYTGGSMTLLGSTAGTWSATAASSGGVDLTLTGSSVGSVIGASFIGGDFNGDGRTDVLWRNTNGTVTDWLAQRDGSFAGNANLMTQVATSQHVAGIGDFNGDGRADVLWRSDSGVVGEWLSNGDGTFTANSNVASAVPTSWHIVGTGDFNGDGRTDVLWQSDDGFIIDWLSQRDGSFSGNSPSFNTSFNSSWHVVGTGDFNHDGRTDILWQNSDGTVTDWLAQADGTFVSNQQLLHTQVDSSWHIVGTGDFNGDGISDVLWQNGSGAIMDWLGQADGTFSGNGLSFTTALDSSWHVVQTGDFNGDGRADILLRSDNGTVIDWFGQSNGTFVSNQGILHTQVPGDWYVQPQPGLI